MNKRLLAALVLIGNAAAATAAFILVILLVPVDWPLLWLLGLLALALLAAAALSYLYLSRQLFDPLHRLEQIIAQAASGQTRRLPRDDGSEIGSLSRAIDQLLARLERSELKLQTAAPRPESSDQLSDVERQNRALEETKQAMLNILDDLSEEKSRTEEEKAKDEILLESIGEGLIATDEYGNITNCNEVAAELLGRKPPDLIGKWFPRAVAVTDEYGKLMPPDERPISRALTTGKIVAANAMYQRPDGSTFPVSMTVSPVVVDGRPIGAVEVFRDISRERELERAKDEFVSLASHQLRTPASGVKAFASMLIDGYAGKLNPKQTEFVKKVYESNERQLRIVDDMLNVARADSGHLSIVKAPTDLTALLGKVKGEQEAVAATRHQSIVVHAPAKPVMANVDVDKLRMVVDNLVSNAIKYSHDGSHIEITLAKTATNITVAVTDQGVGIPKRDFKRLFQKFSRIDNELSTLVGGSGLGLYLVKTIVEMHGGQVEVTSTPGKGSTFTVSLPSKT
jgi:two-component system, OmpR family, sensor histidine kinase VicK